MRGRVKSEWRHGSCVFGQRRLEVMPPRLSALTFMCARTRPLSQGAGSIIRFQEKSASTGSIHSRALTYWIEFEVEFDPKQPGCNTGISWGARMPFPCIGTVKSPGSQSVGSARNWVDRHPAGSPAKFYYEPATGHLRFADESILDLYPWVAILAFFVAGTAGVILLRASRNRLQRLRGVACRL